MVTNIRNLLVTQNKNGDPKEGDHHLLLFNFFLRSSDYIRQNLYHAWFIHSYFQ
jgi:hypothetical protein